MIRRGRLLPLVRGFLSALYYLPRMIEKDFRVQARLSQHLKDVRLILRAARAAGLPVPLSETHRQLLEKAEASGLGELDNSAIVQIFRKAEPIPPA